jgi:hypothetical protein
MRREHAGKPAVGRLRRLGWLVLIWSLSVGAVGLVAAALRMLLRQVFA